MAPPFVAELLVKVVALTEIVWSAGSGGNPGLNAKRWPKNTAPPTLAELLEKTEFLIVVSQ